jgi:hypothetical protein
MCFSQYSEYAPRPVYQYEPPERPAGAAPTKAELDENLYGPVPLPPEWQQPTMSDQGNDHSHETHDHHQAAESTPAAAAAVHVANVQGNGSAEIASIKTQTVEAVVVELANGTKLLICPL